MSDTAKNIVDGFRTLRAFCNEVAKMFRTADGMMEGGDWTPTGNKAVSSTSRVIGDPNSWLPTEFFRCYENEDRPHIMPFIAVLLHDPVPENETVIDEALISAGFIEFEKETEYAVNDWYWASRSHLFMGDEDGNRKDDGTPYSRNPEGEDWEDYKGVAKVNTFAYPLDEMSSGEGLKEKIVQPLLDMLPQDE